MKKMNYFLYFSIGLIAAIQDYPDSIEQLTADIDAISSFLEGNSKVGGRTFQDFEALISLMVINSENYYFNDFSFNKTIDEIVKIYCQKNTKSKLVQVSLKNVKTVLDLKKKFLFIIHGWTDTYESYYVKDLSKAYFNNVGDANICAVDYREISQTELFTIAEPHSFDVADYLAGFIRKISTIYSVSLDNVILVGHSLGGHISGVVGDYLDGKIGVIIAADPCGPGCSQRWQGANNSLTPNSAKYVQTIVTNQNELGAPTWGYHGHQIFWVNLGGPDQSGCGIGNLICAHYRAVEYLISSLERANIFSAQHCRDVNKFKSGKCGSSHCDQLGFYGERKISGNYYLFTKSTPPFATGELCPPADEVTMKNQSH